MRHVPALAVQTSDPDRLARFYTTLGFTEVSRGDDRIELDGAQVRLTLVAGPPPGGADSGSAPGGFVLCVQVDDPQSVRDALLAAGAEEPADPHTDRSGTLLRDPDGNPVRVLPARPAVPEAAPAPSVPQAPTAPPASSVVPTGATPPVPGLPSSALPETYYTDAGVPTFDAVAERIAKQSATADGNAVLDAESERGREEADTLDKLKKAGKDRLEALRKSMGR